MKMISSSALDFVPALLQTPVQSQVAPTSLPMPGVAAERVDGLRCLLLQRDLKTQPQDPSCSMPPVILGQWRN
jgi:hypothetical protein